MRPNHDFLTIKKIIRATKCVIYILQQATQAPKNLGVISNVMEGQFCVLKKWTELLLIPVATVNFLVSEVVTHNQRREK